MAEEIDLVTEDTAADLLQVGAWTLQKWRQRDEGPPYIKVGRLVRYSRRALVRWLEAQTVTPRS